MAWLLLIIALLLILGPLLTYTVYSLPRQQIGYIPIPKERLDQVVAALELNDRSVLFDLGCGDGRVLGAVLAQHPHIRAVGVEINPIVALLARWRLRGTPAEVKRQGLFDLDLSSATLIFTYLNPPTMKRLASKFGSELTAGTRVVSCDFPIPERKPTKTIKVGEPWQLGQTLFVYEY